MAAPKRTTRSMSAALKESNVPTPVVPTPVVPTPVVPTPVVPTPDVPIHGFVDQLPVSTCKLRARRPVEDDDGLMEDVREQEKVRSVRRTPLHRQTIVEEDEQVEAVTAPQAPRNTRQQQQLPRQALRQPSRQPAARSQRVVPAVEVDNVAERAGDEVNGGHRLAALKNLAHWIRWKLLLNVAIWTLIFNIVGTIPQVEDRALKVLCLTDSFRAGSAEIGVDVLGREFCNPIYRLEDRDNRIEHVLEAIDALKKLKNLIPRARYEDQENIWFETEKLKAKVNRMHNEVTFRQQQLVHLDKKSAFDDLFAASISLNLISSGVENTAMISMQEMEKSLDRLIADADKIVSDWKAKTGGTFSALRAYASILLVPRWAPTTRLSRSFKTFATETTVDADHHFKRATRFRDSLDEFLHHYSRATTALRAEETRKMEQCQELVDIQPYQGNLVWRTVAWWLGLPKQTVLERCASGPFDEDCCTDTLANLREYLQVAGDHAYKLKPWGDQYEKAWEQHVSSTTPVTRDISPKLRPAGEAAEDVARLNEAVRAA